MQPLITAQLILLGLEVDVWFTLVTSGMLRIRSHKPQDNTAISLHFVSSGNVTKLFLYSETCIRRNLNKAEICSV
jgi:hypothetical protein